MSKKIKDYLKVYDDFIDLKLCKKVVKKLNKNKEWNLHSYFNYPERKNFSYDKELSTCVDYSMPETDLLNKLVYSAITRYLSEIPKEYPNQFISRASHIRYNKYQVGTMMRLHYDHIHTLFDGSEKGVPILSILGGLNNDYEGGELIFWGDTPIELKEGSIMVFPSNFLYPHQVDEVTKGARYSFVAWAW